MKGNMKTIRNKSEIEHSSDADGEIIELNPAQWAKKGPFEFDRKKAIYLVCADSLSSEDTLSIQGKERLEDLGICVTSSSGMNCGMNWWEGEAPERNMRRPLKSSQASFDNIELIEIDQDYRKDQPERSRGIAELTTKDEMVKCPRTSRSPAECLEAYNYDFLNRKNTSFRVDMKTRKEIAKRIRRQSHVLGELNNFTELPDVYM